MAEHASSERLTGATGTRSIRLWAGLLVPPLAWATHLVLGDLLFEIGCGPAFTGSEALGLTLRTWALIETVALAALTLGAGALSYSASRRLPDGHEAETPWDRAEAMAVMGMANSALFLLLLVYGLFPSFVFHACTTSL